MRMQRAFEPPVRGANEPLEAWGEKALRYLVEYMRELRSTVNVNDGAALIASETPPQTVAEIGRLYLVLGAGATGEDELRFVVNDGAGTLKTVRVTGVTLI
jgi:hypothetical protein